MRSTTLWTAKRNRKRSPWRSLTGLITSVGLLFNEGGDVISSAGVGYL